jgi:hypothetical protein
VVLDVLRNHDRRAEQYAAEANALLATVQVDYPENIHKYEQAFLGLFASE